MSTERSYSPSLPIKMHATDVKTQKIKSDLNFFGWTKVSEAVYRDLNIFCKAALQWFVARKALYK